jgi:ankyrin repeat protein
MPVAEEAFEHSEQVGKCMAPPPIRLEDCGWLLAEPSLLALSREFCTDLRLLERVATARYREGRTRLHYAAGKADATRVEQLVAAGADVNAMDKSDYTPLSWAVAQGRTTAAHALLAAGASPRLFRPVELNFACHSIVSDPCEDTRLKAARHALLLELLGTCGAPKLRLLEAGVLWDLPDIVACSIDDGVTSLNELIRRECLDGSISCETYDIGAIMVNRCSVRGSAACAHLLFPRLSDDFFTDIMESCASLGPAVHDLVRELVGFPLALDNLSKSLNDHFYSNDRCCALFAACGTGDLDLVKALLPMEGVHLGCCGVAPWGPLGCYHSTTALAAVKGHAEIVRYIVANPPVVYNQHDLDTSLLSCVMIGDIQYAKTLLDIGAEPIVEFDELWDNDQDEMFSSCLRTACTLGNVEMVQLLLDAGAQVTTTGNAASPSFELMCAAQPHVPGWHWSIVNGAYVQALEGSKDEACRIDIIRLLVTAGADAAAAGLELDPLFLRAFPKAAKRKRGGRK